MNKIRLFSLDGSKAWALIGASLLYGVALGYTVNAGKNKTWASLLIPPAICVFRVLPERLKFWLLALSIPLSLVQMPRLPSHYGTQLSEIILIFLALDEILFFHREHKPDTKPFITVMVCLLGLFAFGGLIANLKGNDFFSWNVYCLLPLLICFLIPRKIHNREDAWLLVKLSILTIIGFVAIVELAVRSGNYVVYDPIATETVARAYRMADGVAVILGPIRLYSFATRLGAIVALGLPTCVLLLLQNGGRPWWKGVLALTIAALGYVLILTATRGSVLAAAIGTVLVILISGRIRSPVFVGIAYLLLIVLAVWGETILNMLPGYNVQRLLTLSQGVQSIENYRQRTDVLSLAWSLTLKNPLGLGFGYLYRTYLIDDAIIYAVILQATGILGALAFVMIAGYLALRFGIKAIRSPIGSSRDLASVGLSTLAAGLLAGVSSQSVLFDPVHSFVFWTVMAVCYCATASSLHDVRPSSYRNPWKPSLLFRASLDEMPMQSAETRPLL